MLLLLKLMKFVWFSFHSHVCILSCKIVKVGFKDCVIKDWSSLLMKKQTRGLLIETTVHNSQLERVKGLQTNGNSRGALRGNILINAAQMRVLIIEHYLRKTSH